MFEFIIHVLIMIMVSMQRFKGLGEMMPQQLWDTTMDPSQRLLKRVTVDDAIACDKMFSTLMGKNITERKSFIIDNSVGLQATDLDI
jgi:DNA gyrase subunit B